MSRINNLLIFFVKDNLDNLRGNQLPAAKGGVELLLAALTKSS